MKRRAMADKTKRKKKQAALAEAAAGSFEGSIPTKVRDAT